jgi:LmbE family N-acetylglucosaminyl deacetylase
MFKVLGLIPPLTKRNIEKIFLFELSGIFIIFLVFFIRFSVVLPQNAVALLSAMPLPQPNQKIVVFSPHPDDETLGCGGYIQRARHNGSEVFIVLITDGNFLRQGNIRYKEFLNATSQLGVDQDHLIFLNFPDSRLRFVPKSILESNFDEILKDLNPQVVFIPSIYDSNLDHKTAGFTLRDILKNYPNIVAYQYLVHRIYYPQPMMYRPNDYLTPPLELVDFSKKWLNFSLTPNEEQLKKIIIFEYKSQLEDPASRNLLHSFVRENEIFLLNNENQSY